MIFERGGALDAPSAASNLPTSIACLLLRSFESALQIASLAVASRHYGPVPPFEIGSPRQEKAASSLRSMDSIFDRRIIRIATALLSGGLLYFTLSLTPWWPLAWIAPVPLLLASFHASRGETRLLCAIAALVGLTSNIVYYTMVSGWTGTVVVVILQLLEWGFVVLFTRAIVLRSNHWLTVFAYPLIWTALDTLISTFSPHSTFGSLAYTQMNALPIIQIASIAGTPGVVFVITLFSSVLALALYRINPRTHPALAYGIPGLILIAVLAYGAVRLTRSHATTATIPIGLVAIDDFLGPKIPHEKTEAVWKGYEEAVARLAAQGARIVVLPEKIDVKELAITPRRDSLAALARRHSIYLVVGLGLPTVEGWKNRAWLFGPNGELLAEYDKQHLVPGLEAEMSPGHEDVVREIDGNRFGIAICKDMHFASLGRSYGKKGAAVMLEPAWDFYRDGWMSSRIAALRGVENGYAVVHSARESLLSVSDRYGRFLAERRSDWFPGVSVIARVPVGATPPTPYARFGNWFGWVCVTLAMITRFRHSLFRRLRTS
jgi:apolipoprotein N-acyltransferase